MQEWLQEGRTQRIKAIKRNCTERQNRHLRLWPYRNLFSTTRSIVNQWLTKHGRRVGKRTEAKNFWLFSVPTKLVNTSNCKISIIVGLGMKFESLQWYVSILAQRKQYSADMTEINVISFEAQALSEYRRYTI